MTVFGHADQNVSEATSQNQLKLLMNMDLLKNYVRSKKRFFHPPSLHHMCKKLTCHFPNGLDIFADLIPV